MIQALGWVGSACFAVCAIPQAMETYRLGNANGISWAFLLLWIVGEICTLLYVALKTQDLPLIVNYVGNLLCLLVIIFYKMFPRKA